MTLDNQWIEVFSVPRGGKTGGWSAEEVRAMAEAYDPAKHESPLTVGHPRNDAPAYGWTKALRARETSEGLVLEAMPHQVEPQFEELLQTGRFKTRSIAIYPPEESPVPGTPYLRHIGWLGAAAPAVKGLKPVQFGDAEYIEFAVNQKGETMDEKKDGQLTHEEVGVLKQFAERVKAFFGGEPKKDSFSEADVHQRVSDAVTAAETKFTAAMEKLRNEFTEQHKAVETKQAELNAGEAKGKVTAFIEKLAAAGKWVPAFSKTYGLDRVLQRLAGVPDVKLTFTEKKDGNDVEVESTDYAALCRFFNELPQIVPLEEIVGRQKEMADAKLPGTITKGTKVVNVDVAQRARQLQLAAAKEGKTLTYAEASVAARMEIAQRGDLDKQA